MGHSPIDLCATAGTSVEPLAPAHIPLNSTSGDPMHDPIGFRILSAAALMLVAAILISANWPSASGTTAQGVVIENGAGVALGTVANPLVCQ
jgi:hypothetical protein